MNRTKSYKFLSQNITNLRGVGKKVKNLLKKKKLRKFLICYGIYHNLLLIDLI